MPQGLSSPNAVNRSTRPTSSRSTTPAQNATVLSQPLIAQWMANSAIAPSQDLQNFVFNQTLDLKLDASVTPLPEPRKRTRRPANVDDAHDKVPRPPNAFMIFRSDLIKDVHVGLQKVEKKQQNLSVIAGEIWNLMPEEWKQLWRNKAIVRLQEHQTKYPQYKYTPKQRNGRGKKAGKEPSPSFADPAVREYWRSQKLVETYHGPAPPPSRLRRRGVQPYEVPLPSSQPQQQAGSSSAPEESQWHNLTMPTRPSSNTSDGYYSPPTAPLEVHMMNVYSHYPTTLPPSAHSSPGSSHSAPASFPLEHNLSSDFQAPPHTIRPPMASLLGMTLALDPVPRAHSAPLDPIAEFPPFEYSWPAGAHFALPPFSEDPTDFRGNFNYDLGDTWSGTDAQRQADGKPAGDALGQSTHQAGEWHYNSSTVSGPDVMFGGFPMSNEEFAAMGTYALANEVGNAAPAS